VVVEPVVAELVEASKRPQVFREPVKAVKRSNAKKPNGGFDKLSHRKNTNIEN